VPAVRWDRRSREVVTLSLGLEIGLVVAFGALAGLIVLLRVRAMRAEVRELTARNAAALRESEVRFHLAFKTSPEPLTITRGDGTLVWVNDGFLQLHGLTEAQCLGKTPGELGIFVDVADRKRIGERLRRGEVIRNVDVRVNAGDRSVRTLAFSASAFHVNGELYTLALARDVTAERAQAAEQRRLELQVGLLERLAAVGQVAAGVAHEINNPLSYVLANLDLVAERLRASGADGDLLTAVAEARMGADRVAHIVRDLRVFARGEREPSQRCKVADVVRSAVAITSNDIRHRARLEVRLEPVGDAAIAEGRLAQVLVNVLANACLAIPEGHATENEIRVTVSQANGRAIVDVADTGCGMAPEVQARIFEPFFTTREVGEGMGLGLALCHTMVTEAGGTIAVESAVGQGSTFRITLPLAGDAEAAAATAPATRDGGPRLRVLVVDDEPLVARSLARMLAPHEVRLETSGAEALETLRRGERFDAVVCDLMMPDVTGMDLHAWAAQARPDHAERFVFVTGGAFSERAREFIARASRPVLEKPVDRRRLQEAVGAAAATPRQALA
jgi:PAS domain S-box-containing protein